MYKQSIVVDVRMINNSGIGTYLKNILPIIATKFRLILLGNEEKLKVYSWTENMEIIPFEAKIYSLKEQITFPKIIPETNLLWCPHFNTPFFKTKAKNIVTTIHDVNHLATKKNKFDIKEKYARKLINNTVTKSKKIVTVSKFSKNEILKHTNSVEHQIRVIYNGIDPNFCITRDNDVIDKLPKKYFLFVGNVKPHKNLITLLKAFQNLPEQIKKEYKLVVLGKNEGFITSDKNIPKFINKNKLKDYVHFTGYINDELIPSVYKNASVFIFPSNYEGFGLPLIEAMACKTPVIASDIPCSKEIAGNAAVYFEKNNYNDLTKKITLLLSNKTVTDELVVNGTERIKHYNWIDAANQHSNVFREVLDSDNS